MRPLSMRTTGLAPPDAGDAPALPAPAVRTVAATLTADTANNAARRTRRARVVFMLSPLPGPADGAVFGLVLRVVVCRTPRAKIGYWYRHRSAADGGQVDTCAGFGPGHAGRCRTCGRQADQGTGQGFCGVATGGPGEPPARHRAGLARTLAGLAVQPPRGRPWGVGKTARQCPFPG